MERKGFSAGSWADRRKQIQPISISQTELVKIGHLPGREDLLPLVIEPVAEYAGTLKLHEWAPDHLDLINRSVLKFGGVLFRNFDTKNQDDFHRFLDTLGVALIQYNESSTPRTQLKNNVYTSTEFPNDQTIALHNELSTSATVPQKIWFFCDLPADEGGQTPIADVRRVYARLSPETRAKFEEKGWKLVRNYGDGFGLTWQDSFHTEDHAVVEKYCREQAITWDRMGEVKAALLRALQPHASAMLLDPGGPSVEQVPAHWSTSGMTLLVIDTKAEHELTDGGYATRREQSEEAARLLGVDWLSQASEDDAAGIQDELLSRRARHVVTETARVHEVVEAMAADDWARVGTLFTASHVSLRDDYEVSSPELDVAVEAALGAGALGARMTGAGFGGSAIALLPDEAVDAVQAACADAFERHGFGTPEIFLVAPGRGAGRV